MTDHIPKIVCNWLHFCDYAFIDAMKKTVLIGIFDRIFTQQVPTVHSGCFLTFELDGPPQAKEKIRIQMTRPTGSGNVVNLIADCEFGPDGRASFILGINGLQIPDLGKYTVLISAGPEVIKTASIMVAAVPKGGN